MLARFIGQVTRDVYEGVCAVGQSIIDIPSDIEDGFDEGLFSGPADTVEPKKVTTPRKKAVVKKPAAKKVEVKSAVVKTPVAKKPAIFK